MERRLVFAAAALLSAILLGIAFWYLGGPTTDTAYFDAATLCQAFSEPEGEAALVNRSLSVEGTIKQIGSEGDRSYLSIDGGPHGEVRCFFDGARALRLVDLEPGAKVVVEGRATGATNGVVTLTGCQTVE